MSHLPFSLSPDLWKLRNDGFDIEIKSGHLVVRDVPYLDSKREIRRGLLVAVLTLAADIARKPADHTIWFAGELPHDNKGVPLPIHSSNHHEIAPGLVVDYYLSRKPLPSGGYNDFYEKITAYVAFISSPAQFVDPLVSAKTFPVYEAKEEASVFRYIDTASSRAGIAAMSAKLEIDKVAIVGVGGTGSYVLDLVAKTPVKEIHLYDDDKFLQHNAFRCPGAPSIDDLKKHATKAEFFKDKYSNMRLHIEAHAQVTPENVHELGSMKFVFLCIDKPSAKVLIVHKLEEFHIPFIDVGMGIYEVDKNLAGTLRVTTSTVEKRQHVYARSRIQFEDVEAGNEYSRNIQIADLNALNAALAVVKWKKLFGFYKDLKNEYFATYHILDNKIVNEDHL